MKNWTGFSKRSSKRETPHQGAFLFYSKLTLNSTSNHTFDNILLAGQIKNDNGHNCQDQHGHHGAHVAAAIASLQVLDGDRDRFIVTSDDKIGQKIIVPDPHGIQNCNCDVNWPENWKYNQEKCLDWGTAVDRRSFLYFNRDAFDETAKYKYG